MKILKLLFVFLAILWMATSCEYDNPQPFPVNEDPVSFSADIVPIFDQSCNMSGCHATGAVKPDLTAGNAYASLFAEGDIDVDNPENSKLYRKINTGTMKSYSTPSNAQLILSWIKQGALDN